MEKETINDLKNAAVYLFLQAGAIYVLCWASLLWSYKNDSHSFGYVVHFILTEKNPSDAAVGITILSLVIIGVKSAWKCIWKWI
jgi:hypothetical protein